MTSPIFTSSLKLVPATLEMLDFVLAENDSGLASVLNVEIEPGWSTFGLEPFKWTREAQAVDPEHIGWLTYLAIHLADKKLIGTCGFKGKPDSKGNVEIGYEIAASYQLRGLASEAAIALIKHAFSFPQVNSVLAHTLAQVNESGAVLKKAGLQKVGLVEDPDEGTVWQWCIERKAFKFQNA
jgi:RimJ/RimL family protein N-acetyltransferase